MFKVVLALKNHLLLLKRHVGDSNKRWFLSNKRWFLKSANPHKTVLFDFPKRINDYNDIIIYLFIANLVNNKKLFFNSKNFDKSH